MMQIASSLCRGSVRFGFMLVFFESQVFGQFALEQGFDHILADFAPEGVEILQGFDALLLEELFQCFPVKCQIKPP
jgi:hypothetical protein